MVVNGRKVLPFYLCYLAREAESHKRSPQQCCMDDLRTASHIVALNEIEHRPLMIERFPDWEGRTEYWKVSDIEVVAPSVALSQIDSQVAELVGRFATAQYPAR